MFFRGYVETKDKKCIEKFKNRTDFKTYEQVKSLPEFAGILDEETILVDIDDFEQSEVLMNIVEDLQLNCRVYATTRGKHFLFKNAGVEKCFTHCKLARGLAADIKVGVKNSNARKGKSFMTFIRKMVKSIRKFQSGCFQSKEKQNSWTWMQVMEETRHCSITS